MSTSGSESDVADSEIKRKVLSDIVPNNNQYDLNQDYKRTDKGSFFVMMEKGY